jgi:hypothetical protein
MGTARTVRILLTAAALFAAPATALAQDAITAPAVKTIGVPKSAMVPSLAVINSRGANLQENVLTLTGVAPNSIVFADRPVRAAGHVLTSDFFKEWDNSFAKDPPNATISVLSADGASVKDAVVVLKTPKLEGDKLTFEVSVLEGDLSKADGPAALFIDWFAARGFGGRAFVGGAGFRGVGWHGAWYGHPGAALATGAVVGGAIGATAGAYGAYDPYYPNCGVYPYPPCY